MSISGSTPLGLVRPGEGVSVDQERLAPIRDQLLSGSYVIDAVAQRSVQETLADSSTPQTVALDILNLRPNKTFRNAYISLLMEQMWSPYSELATGEDIGLYTMRFDGSEAKLTRQSLESTEDLSLHETADSIAASNQDMATYFSCELFSSGKVPEVCCDTEIDGSYFDAFREQAELQFAHTGTYFNTIPSYMDAPSKFVASGLQVVRTYVFGVPNLIDGVSANEDIQLTPAQHRVGVESTLARSIPPYYSLTGPLIKAINKRVADRETGQLLPEHWMSNGDPDRFMVFPKPGIVRDVNDAATQSGNLPVQTGCPVIHSRVPSIEVPDIAIPLPRSLAQLVLRQLDVLYYPKRQREFS